MIVMVIGWLKTNDCHGHWVVENKMNDCHGHWVVENK